MLRILGILLTVFAVTILRIQQGLTLPAFDVGDAQSRDVIHANRRVLTPEEVELADSARAHIAKVLERNLIRLFAAMTIEEKRQRNRQQRQQPGGAEEESEDEDPAETATINPNTLPQVAALLGAIFSGNLNLTNVVDRAFYLVPDAVRSQVTGLFSLLGGKGQPNTSGTSGSTSAVVTPAPQPEYIPHPLDPTPELEMTNVTEEVKGQGQEVVELVTTTARPVDVAFGSVFEDKAVPSGIGSGKWSSSSAELGKPVVPVAEPLLFDDWPAGGPITEEELQRAEAEVIEAAKRYESNGKDKQPRFFLGSVSRFLRSDQLNYTSIFEAMPDLFRGAREAFVLLESLGEIATGEDEE